MALTATTTEGEAAEGSELGGIGDSSIDLEERLLSQLKEAEDRISSLNDALFAANIEISSSEKRLKESKQKAAVAVATLTKKIRSLADLLARHDDLDEPMVRDQLLPSALHQI